MTIIMEKKNIRYDNVGYFYKYDNIKIEFIFGLLDITINHKNVYRHVFRIENLKSVEIENMMLSAIIGVMLANKVCIDGIYIK